MKVTVQDLSEETGPAGQVRGSWWEDSEIRRSGSLGDAWVSCM